MERWRAKKVILKLTIGQQLLLWPWESILCDHCLDLVLKDGLYHLHSDAYVNLIEQVVNAVGSERSRIEIKFKVYVEPMTKSYWKRND